ncbi:sensor histidine kinase [Deinococcus cellulosilyticus]|uniref:histidine kinase n=1 Tax=Deinococcus cellulosilyticus (strain DSM 18568 / NBRC 106333 / KACC 11606 / 5516J-15) TaxID=1223518 RepID=A0A511N4H0_DEIC1|nr:ATP-binding protein [Deinococcus cellulosilyticus]GEM47774.1 hypothetical protein DC3_34090 [Deinococcus cellulosilyticus NBRC 106333 = KACC 11606]
MLRHRFTPLIAALLVAGVSFMLFTLAFLPSYDALTRQNLIWSNHHYYQLNQRIACILMQTSDHQICSATYEQNLALLRDTFKNLNSEFPQVKEVETYGDARLSSIIGNLQQAIQTTPPSIPLLEKAYRESMQLSMQSRDLIQDNRLNVLYTLRTQQFWLRILVSITFGLLAAMMTRIWVNYHEEKNKVEAQKQLQMELNAITSHELRKPLQQLVLATNLLSRDSLTADQRRTLLERLVNSTQELTVLTDLSRLEDVYVNLELKWERIDIREMVREFAQEEPRVQCILPLTPVMLDVDVVRIKQVIRNLVENALKYAPSHTNVDIGVYAMGKEVTISVRDYGPGIPEEEQRKVMEPFYRLKRNNGKKGWGLGLAVVKRFVEAHGGHLRISTPDGGGTQVDVVLPRLQRAGHQTRDLPGHNSHEPLSS